MPQIADINDNELWIAETTLTEQYGKKKDIQVVDNDIRLYSSDDENDDLAQCVVSILQIQADHERVVQKSTGS